MSKPPTPTPEERAAQVGDLLVRIYEIHQVIIAETGGLPGWRDVAMLHAAAGRPFATFGGEELYPSPFEKAAALFHSLIKSHPFMDGTKRTAFASALYFLEQSGYTIPGKLPLKEVIRFCLEVAEEGMQRAAGEQVQPKSIPDIADWFRRLIEG